MKNRKFRAIAILPVACVIAAGVLAATSLHKKEDTVISASGTPNVTFGCVLSDFGWDNNQTINPGFSATILDFSDNFGTAADSTNQATANFEIGTALTINGVCIKDIPTSVVSYAHGVNHFYFCVPVNALTPTAAYPTTTMHINAGAKFMDKYLPEVTLYLINDHWKAVNTCAGIAWNNHNYNEVHGVQGTPTDAYSILLQYQNNLSDVNVVDMTNAVTADSDVGNKITVNGVPLNQMEGSIVCMPAANPYLYIYFKDSQIRYSGDYFRVTLEIKNGTRYKDSFLPYTKTVITLPIGNFNTWVLNPADVAPTPVTFDRIEWNAATGNTTCSVNPGVLLKFSSDLSTNAFDGNGSLMARNLAYTNAGDHIKVNGTPISQISGSELKYYAAQFLFIYTPTMYNIPTGKLASSLTIDKDTLFFDVLLPECGVYYRDDGFKWTTNPPIIYTTPNVELRSTSGKVNSLSFESHVDVDYYLKLVRDYGKNAIELGTFIIDANSYYTSGQVGLANYVNNVVASSKTYTKIVNAKQDFFNLTKYLKDGYFGFKGSLIDIKETNYAREFIGVGYIKVNNQYYFGNENPTPISFFELMNRKYQAGEITTTEYYTPSVQISEGTNSFDLSDVSINTSSHTFSYAGCGYYALTATTRAITVVQCGNDVLRVNIPQNTTKYISVINGKVVFEDSVTPMYSVVDTTRELWPDSNSNVTYCTADNVSDIAQAFNSKSMRVWAQVTCMINDPWRCGISNADGTFSLNMDEINKIKTVVSKFKKKGMHDICLMLNGVIQDYSREIWYYAGDPSHKYLYTTDEYLAFNANREVLVPMMCTVTFPEVGTADYVKFMNNQKEFVRQLSIELDGYIDVYEGFNEIDVGGQMYYRNYYLNDCPASNALANGFAPSRELIAQWSMDYCKAVTDGVKAANSSIRVLTPAFGCVGEIPGSGRYYKTSNTISDIYSYIKNSGTGHPKDYFQGLNIHPYVLLSKFIEGDGYQNYMWEESPSWISPNPDNKDFADDWNTMITSIESTLSANGDSKVPMYFSEFGFTDLGYGTSLHTTDGSTFKDGFSHPNFDKILPTALTDLNEHIQSKNYIRSIYYFRQLDWAYDSIDGSYPWALCGEPNFGVIEEDLTLKDLGKTLFGIMNGGSSDYSPVTNVLNKLKGGN